MATKGSSGSRRWIERRAIDTRPIHSIDYDQVPTWLRLLEAFAPFGCLIFMGAALGVAAYAFAVDYFAGHL